MEDNYQLTLSVKEVSKILGISKSLTYDLISQNKIPHKRLGGRIIIPKTKFESWLSNTNS